MCNSEGLKFWPMPIQPYSGTPKHINHPQFYPKYLWGCQATPILGGRFSTSISQNWMGTFAVERLLPEKKH